MISLKSLRAITKPYPVFKHCIEKNESENDE